MSATGNLTHRTEAALLGALLFDRHALADMAFLDASDFASPHHRELFSAIRDVVAADPVATGSELAEKVADHLGRNRVNIAELHELALSGPEPSTAAFYGRLVMEAAMDRELADHAVRIAAEAGSERGIDPRADHLAQLAEAIQFHSRSVETTAAYVGAVDADAMTAELSTDRSLYVQDQILADLFQHPELIGEVATWLEPEVFCSGRKEIYETFVALDQYGEPVDEVTVTWSLGRRAAVADTLRGFDSDAADSVREQVPAGALTRLGNTAVELGVAVELGRELLTEHVRAEIAAESGRVAGLAAKAEVTSTHVAAILSPGVTAGHQAAVTQEPGPRLIQRPPTPELGPDGPKLTW
jgi:replicative DNA helicase